jgi:hypothetical protein
MGDALDASDVMDGSAGVTMKNAGAGAGIANPQVMWSGDVNTKRSHKTRSGKHYAHAHTIHQCTQNYCTYHFGKQQRTYMLLADSIHKMSLLPSL